MNNDPIEFLRGEAGQRGRRRDCCNSYEAQVHEITCPIKYPEVSRNLATTSSDPNTRQVGGNHYRRVNPEFQHWDFAAQQNYDYFQGVITKYVDRWREKDGLKDLEKAQHYLEKYIQMVRAGTVDRGPQFTQEPVAVGGELPKAGIETPKR